VRQYWKCAVRGCGWLIVTTLKSEAEKALAKHLEMAHPTKESPKDERKVAREVNVSRTSSVSARRGRTRVS